MNFSDPCFALWLADKVLLLSLIGLVVGYAVIMGRPVVRFWKAYLAYKAAMKSYTANPATSES